MVCEGPEPTENSPRDITPPPKYDLATNGNQDDSDDDQNEHFGYEPLPQGPETIVSHHGSDESETSDGESVQEPRSNVLPIEPIENVLAREVWNGPRPSNSIQMDNETALQVISAMANFQLPQTSIPEWAQSISEDQWKQTLHDRIEKLKQSS
ncbi:unnamed protein product [Leptidea sinapis]|uniref:Male-enhanced antigen 1 n=1 Tax=Leptidea sinapis TaxID=189913 RepID=A0A5E4PY63_9NEOP|nr:unnamed protein product [Leptidea sinapis]